ncbi:uncharacterized protein LOC122252509 [Penaeus japonicus]|uniref:uncharacterized protein LOC122252509 n=1 Tax=Penaeus japonicus TaxID=27405 RepID=UPI001C7130BC|nr:uncharacterized protein LOC122252509 [Penaeus japonicus]
MAMNGNVETWSHIWKRTSHQKALRARRILDMNFKTEVEAGVAGEDVGIAEDEDEEEVKVEEEGEVKDEEEGEDILRGSSTVTPGLTGKSNRTWLPVFGRNWSFSTHLSDAGQTGAINATIAVIEDGGCPLEDGNPDSLTEEYLKVEEDMWIQTRHRINFTRANKRINLGMKENQIK